MHATMYRGALPRTPARRAVVRVAGEKRPLRKSSPSVLCRRLHCVGYGHTEGNTEASHGRGTMPTPSAHGAQ